MSRLSDQIAWLEARVRERTERQLASRSWVEQLSKFELHKIVHYKLASAAYDMGDRDNMHLGQPGRWVDGGYLRPGAIDDLAAKGIGIAACIAKLGLQSWLENAHVSPCLPQIEGARCAFSASPLR